MRLLHRQLFLWVATSTLLATIFAACTNVQRVRAGRYVQSASPKAFSLQLDRSGSSLTLSNPAGKSALRKITLQKAFVANPCPTQGLRTVVHEWFRVAGGPLVVGDRTISDPILISSCFGKHVVLTELQRLTGKGELLSVDLQDGLQFTPVHK